MFETQRLKIEKITKDDFEWLVEMRSDPDVYRYLGGIEMQNADALAKRLPFYLECHEKYGFGFSVMALKATGERIGTSGLQPLEETGEIEVGYNLAKSTGDTASAMNVPSRG